jgi:peroxin-5
MLGQLYAELDQDVEAIQCLRKGHEVDPYNLDSLLALGVSCTNELDQLEALRYLRRWIENHEEHGVLAQGLTPPPEYDYEAWRLQVTSLFNQAAVSNPLDANVFVALGVMENINRNYDAAIQALAAACRLRSNDHTAWNKLGATLANSGKSEQAVIAYHQGLQLKPNYARSWSNLAIAHANLGQHADAARFYLSSLVLNPQATHIWNFLHSAVLNMNVNASEMQAVDQRDLAACTKAIEGVLDPLTLPKPKQELPQPPDEILASIGL